MPTEIPEHHLNLHLRLYRVWNASFIGKERPDGVPATRKFAPDNYEVEVVADESKVEWCRISGTPYGFRLKDVLEFSELRKQSECAEDYMFFANAA